MYVMSRSEVRRHGTSVACLRAMYETGEGPQVIWKATSRLSSLLLSSCLLSRMVPEAGFAQVLLSGLPLELAASFGPSLTLTKSMESLKRFLATVAPVLLPPLVSKSLRSVLCIWLDIVCQVSTGKCAPQEHRSSKYAPCAQNDLLSNLDGNFLGLPPACGYRK